MSHKNQQTDAKNFTIMMGVPAAGKSTVANRMFGETHQFIDCDAIKQSHPDYDPKNPGVLHAWSKAVEKGMLNEAFTNPESNIVYDTTGTNYRKVMNYANKAVKAGYEISIVFVTVPEAESLRRNSLRERVVDEPILLEKFDQITYAASVVSEKVADFTTVDNSAVDETLLGA
jgi:predicted kinase